MSSRIQNWTINTLASEENCCSWRVLISFCATQNRFHFMLVNKLNIFFPQTNFFVPLGGSMFTNI